MTKINFDNATSDFPQDAYLTVAGLPWYKSKLKVTKCENYCLSYKWYWWEETWFQSTILIPLYSLAIYLIYNM